MVGNLRTVIGLTFMEKTADVCLIVEGAYPYVTGGVSTWVHDLIVELAPMTFHVVAICADCSPKVRRYAVPGNLIGLTDLVLQPPEVHSTPNANAQAIITPLEKPLQALLQKGNGRDFQQVLEVLKAHPGLANRQTLMNSDAAFGLLQRMYEDSVPAGSFLQYFWTWRALVGGIFSVLLATLPKARVFHAISTGYAGLLLARSVLETGRTGLLTEHGIYTNERRIEIAMAEWLNDQANPSLEIEKQRRDLRDVWIDAFVGYSRTCYEYSTRIITLYRGNQAMQVRDGAPPERMLIIPNGVDVKQFSDIVRDPGAERPTVALIGRVVAIKDIKTYIRAIANLSAKVPRLRALIIGPIDEEPNYFLECQQMVSHLCLSDCVEFTGRVKVTEFLRKIDVVALTSLSEAQPLVLLEAGAAGIPVVATDVGACRDMIEGEPNESPALGNGGIVTPMANPNAIANALAELLLDSNLRAQYGKVLRLRTTQYYNKEKVQSSYQNLYRECSNLPDRSQALMEAS
jgi:polysaccharide biosynthesis protein PelF